MLPVTVLCSVLILTDTLKHKLIFPNISRNIPETKKCINSTPVVDDSTVPLTVTSSVVGDSTVPLTVTALSISSVKEKPIQDDLNFNEVNKSEDLGEHFNIFSFAAESIENDFLLWMQKDADCPIEKGVVFYQGECSRLLDGSACSQQEWLLLASDGLPECRIRPCPIGELLFNENCINISNNSACNSSEILYVEFTGDVYCDCMPGFIFDYTVMTCVGESRQGFCPKGQVMEKEANRISCVQNNCPTDDMIYNSNDKQCYKKTFEGNCSENGLSVMFNNNNKTVYCTANRSLLKVQPQSSCPLGSKKDFFDRCQKTFKTSFRVPSPHIPSFSFSCPETYLRLPNGVCKKHG